MNLFKALNSYRQQNPLGVRLLTAILLCSSAITLVATATQLYLDYRYELSAIDERIQQIEASSLDSLTSSLWEINPEQIQVQLDGLKQLPDVVYLELDTPFGEHFFAGSPPQQQRTVHHVYPLKQLANGGRIYPLGTFKLTISLEQIYERLEDRVLVILTTQGIKTFLVSIFILFIFHRLVTQHLGTMARYARRLKLDRLETPLRINRKKPSSDDELHQVIHAMNEMRESMLEDIKLREVAEQALAKLNAELEQRVTQRTGELEKANTDLRTTLSKLRATQERLIESEKMAALGGLVAGVAHEINTPIGIGFTAASFLEKRTRDHLDKKTTENAELNGEKPEKGYLSGKPKKEQAAINQPDADHQIIELALESSQLICQNLERAAQLVSAFKLVSVDQSSEQRRQFNLKEYLQEILLSLNPKLKKTQHLIDITCPDDLMMDSYPGCYYQIITNLIFNSLIHGFENINKGTIHIDVTQDGDSIALYYRDNGVGIPSGFERKLFEPFVTTKRNQGCSGLGMHIAFNLVTQLLQGEIYCKQEAKKGACFVLILPINPSISAIENEL